MNYSACESSMRWGLWSVHRASGVAGSYAGSCRHRVPTGLRATMANWFRDAFGFQEPKDYHAARDLFRVREVPSVAAPPSAGPALELEAISSHRVFHIGPFEDPSVAQLRARVAEMLALSPPLPAGVSGVSRGGRVGRDPTMCLCSHSMRSEPRVASRAALRAPSTKMQLTGEGCRSCTGTCRTASSINSTHDPHS